jgi:hypothetical protein
MFQAQSKLETPLRIHMYHGQNRFRNANMLAEFDLNVP